MRWYANFHSKPLKTKLKVLPIWTPATHLSKPPI